MQVWNVLHAARWKCRTQKSPKKRHLRIIVQFCRAIFSQLRHISTIGKKLLSSNANVSSTCPHNMVNFGLLAAEIGLIVWGTPANFNGFRVLAALLHGTLVAKLCGVEQRAPPIFCRRPSHMALAHILVRQNFISAQILLLSFLFVNFAVSAPTWFRNSPYNCHLYLTCWLNKVIDDSMSYWFT